MNKQILYIIQHYSFYTNLIYINNIYYIDYSKDSFNFLQLIGKGGYSKVYRVEDKITKQKYVAKVTYKPELILKGSTKNALRERKLLEVIDSE